MCAVKKIPSLVPCPKHSWGPAFLMGNGPLCMGGTGVRGFSRLAWEGLLLSVMPWGRSPPAGLVFFSEQKCRVVAIWFSCTSTYHRSIVPTVRTILYCETLLQKKLLMEVITVYICCINILRVSHYIFEYLTRIVVCKKSRRWRQQGYFIIFHQEKRILNRRPSSLVMGTMTLWMSHNVLHSSLRPTYESW